jgi:hypothetical protein
MNGVEAKSARFGLAIALGWNVLSFDKAALAAEGVYNRTAETAQVGSSGVVPGCPGRLFESFADVVDQKGWSYGLQLVCATSPTSAAWVLIANSKCFDAAGADCSSAKARALPAFNARADFASDSHPPYAMQYALLKYGLGRNCQATTQMFSAATLAPSPTKSRSEAWICGQLDFFDGTRDANGAIDDPGKFRAIAVSTASSQRLTAAAPEYRFPEIFLALPYWYSYSFQ